LFNGAFEGISMKHPNNEKCELCMERPATTIMKEGTDVLRVCGSCVAGITTRNGTSEKWRKCELIE